MAQRAPRCGLRDELARSCPLPIRRTPAYFAERRECGTLAQELVWVPHVVACSQVPLTAK